MNTLTINSTETVQKLKSIGATILGRNNNHQVTFEIAGRKYEICAKNNKDYQLNLLDYSNEDFKRELSFNVNPVELLNRDWKANISRN